MSELHTENESAPNELITQAAAPTDTGTTESGAELATDTGAGQENPTESEAQQKAMDRAVHQKHKARRETEAANARAAAAEAKLDAIEAAKPTPTVSKIPDREYMTDAEFDAAMIVRDQEVAAKAAHNTRLKDREDAQVRAQQQAQQDQQQQSANALKSYRSKATAAGFDDAVMTAAETAVVNFGINSEQLQYIIDIDDGSIMQHLAANPMDLDELSRLSPMKAGSYIDSTLTEKAKVFKHKTSNAPAPVEPLSGNGVDPDMNKNPWLSGGEYR